MSASKSSAGILRHRKKPIRTLNPDTMPINTYRGPSFWVFFMSVFNMCKRVFIKRKGWNVHEFYGKILDLESCCGSLKQSVEIFRNLER